MHWFIAIAVVTAMVAAVALRRGREPRYVYGRWRGPVTGTLRVIAVMDGP
jgi:hypothetical protein